MAVLDYCGLGSIPRLLVGPCDPFWRQGGGARGEGPAPDPHRPWQEVDVRILVWLLPSPQLWSACFFLG